MSGIEALGAVASAAQLAYYLFETVSVIAKQFKRLRNVSKRLQQHIDTVNHLLGVAEQVQSNQWLQTPAIALLLGAVLKHAEHAQKMLLNLETNSSENLKLMFNYWRAYKHTKKEEEVLQVFATLEEHKSALTLCILEVQSKQMGEGFLNSTKLLGIIPQVESIQEDLSYLRLITSAPSSMVMDGDAISSCLTDSTISAHASCSAEQTATNADMAKSEKQQGKCAFATIEQFDVTKPVQRVSSQPEIFESGNTYENLFTSGRACQINGDIGEGDTQLRRHCYTHVAATGSSIQINGNIGSNSLGFLSTSVDITS